MSPDEPVAGVLMLRDHDSWAGGRSRRTGYAVHLPAAGVLALVDPPPLALDECARLDALGPPTHIVLAVNWHLRGAEAHRARWGCPVLISEAGIPTAEIAFDATFTVGDVLWDAVEVVQHITELGHPDEAALLIGPRRQHPGPRLHQRVLYVADAVCGGRDDIGVPEGEVGQYTLMGRAPEQIARLIPDPAAARGALERPLRLDFDALAFGHGSPVLREPHASLRRFLARDDVWSGAPRHHR